MSEEKSSPVCWPSHEQELLLRAALLKGQSGYDAWQKWKSEVGFRAIDLPSRPLLPMVYENLTQSGLVDPDFAKLKGMYTRTWYQNQILFGTLSAVVRTLQRFQIKTLVLKGAALNILYYKQMGLRPITEIDLLVPFSEANRTWNILKESGWKSKLRRIDRYLFIRNSSGLYRDAGEQMELHWHTFIQNLQPEADEIFWNAAIPIEINSIKSSALNPADQLMYVCANGTRFNPSPSVDWITDIQMILRSGPVDWERLVANAQTFRLTLTIHERLEYLRKKFDTFIPNDVIEKLQSAPVSSLERKDYQIASHSRPILGALPFYWMTFSGVSRNWSLTRKLRGFIQFLQSTWNAENTTQLLLCILTKSIRRISRALLSHRHRST